MDKPEKDIVDHETLADLNTDKASSEEQRLREEISFIHRIVEASKGDQDPSDRLWAAVLVLAAIVFILGGFLVETRLYISDTVEVNRQLDYERGSVDCLSVVVDNDRDFDLPPYCGQIGVIIYYPQEVCDSFFPNSSECGQNQRES